MIRKRKERIKSLDFLRGIAIFLVLLRHKYLFDFTVVLGWIGVDLFFVLSGFLVSGLLFIEFKKYGDFDAKLFLIRRGFKIYPIYYLSFLLYLPYLLSHNKTNLWAIFYDFIFIQNYTTGWGYVYAASWSLAIEEHFYFGLCICFLIIVKYFPSILKPIENKLNYFEIGILICLGICNVLRVIYNFYNPEMYVKSFTMSHLRIDSLLFGVFIAYWYHFKKPNLISFFNKNKLALGCLSITLLAYTPFVEPLTSVFVKTVGFTMLYISFGIFLLFALFDEKLFEKATNIIGKRAMGFICKVGFSSYSVYVIHTLIIFLINKFDIQNRYLGFFLVFVFSVFFGILLTNTIEVYFLKLRNKYFKSRY